MGNRITIIPIRLQLGVPWKSTNIRMGYMDTTVSIRLQLVGKSAHRASRPQSPPPLCIKVGNGHGGTFLQEGSRKTPAGRWRGFPRRRESGPPHRPFSRGGRLVDRPAERALI